jgi:fatty acid CoA ligase FadD9
MSQGLSGHRSHAVAARSDGFDRRTGELLDNGPQFSAGRPDASIYAAFSEPGACLATIIETVMERFTDCPAVGERSVKLVTSGAGDAHTQMLPSLDTLTYGQLGRRVTALRTALAGGGNANVHAGAHVVVGRARIDYTVLDSALSPTALLASQTAPSFAAAPLPDPLGAVDGSTGRWRRRSDSTRRRDPNGSAPNTSSRPSRHP